MAPEELVPVVPSSMPELDVMVSAGRDPTDGAESEPFTVPAPVAIGDMDSDMMAKFEALSRAFKSEVETLFGQEKETAREDIDKMRERIVTLEAALVEERSQVSAIGCAIHAFVAAHQETQLEKLFSSNDAAVSFHGPQEAKALRSLVDSFLEVNSGTVRPELAQAEHKISELQLRAQADAEEMEQLREALAVAKQLKSQEERELAEFKALRDKESEVQTTKIEAEQLQAQCEALREELRQRDNRAAQHNASLKEKSDKVISLVKQLEQQGEQLRLLSDENNTLRLELGRDVEYLKAITPPPDPLSYKCSAGSLSEEFVTEEERLSEDLRAQLVKFPGLAASGGHCRQWCDLHLARVGEIHKSFLHRLQDYKASFPEDVHVEFISPTQEAEGGWSQQEERLRQADAMFQESEKEHTQKWEEHRLKLTSERDAKVRQLLEQAERSQSKAEKQLLLQQSTLFGQRMDRQIEQAWEEQRKERDARWAAHQDVRQKARQKHKDLTLSAQQRSEDIASASGRFQDMAKSKLASAEDAWLRKSEKEAAVSPATLKTIDLAACLLAASGDGCGEDPKLPPKASQHTGVGIIVDRVEEMLKSRVERRRHLRHELEQQSLQHLRTCVEKFIVREAAQQKAARAGGEEEVPPEYSQADVISALLRMRQHRHLGEVLRRQFFDFLLTLRVAVLAAMWLLPEDAAKALGAQVGVGQTQLWDLPPPQLGCVKPGADGRASGSRELDGVPGQAGGSLSQDDAAVEGNYLFNNICLRVLERSLTVLAAQHRDELLELKRSYAAEQRIALQTLCQCECEKVAQALSIDIAEYEVQVSTRLLADCEYHLSEERKQMANQVKTDVAVDIARYKRQLQEEEQSILHGRRKWLTERLIVLQASAPSPGDRALVQRLRQELHACESKIAQHDNELVQAPSRPRLPSGEKTKSPRPGSTGRKVRRSASPAAKELQPQPSATGQASSLDVVDTSVVPTSSATQSRGPHAAPASPRLPLPQFGDARSSGPGPATPEFSGRPPQPLYEWPFETCAPPETQTFAMTPPPLTPRSLSVPVGPRLKPMDCLANVSPRGVSTNMVSAQAATPPAAKTRPPRSPAPPSGLSAGLSLGMPPSVGSVKPATRNRSMPPLLPPVHSPRV